MTKERTLSRVREDLAAGRRGVAVRRLRAMLAADPADLEPYRLLTEIYRSAGNAAEAGRWGYLTGDATAEEIQAFERAHPQPWARLRLLGKSLDPARLPAAARARLTELQRQATEVTIPIQHPGVGSRAVPGARTAPVARTTTASGPVSRAPSAPPAAPAAPRGVETVPGTGDGSDEPPTVRLTADTAPAPGTQTPDAAPPPGAAPVAIPTQRQPEPGRPAAPAPTEPLPAGTTPQGTTPQGTMAAQDPLREADPTVAIWLPDGGGAGARTSAVGQQRARASRWSLPPAGRHSSAEPSTGGADRPAGARGMASSAAARSLDVAGRVLGAARYLVVGTNRARDQYRSAGESTRNFILLGLLILLGLVGSVAAVGGVRAIFGIHNWLSPVRAIFDALVRLFTG